jgi:hypothetical protein
VFRKIAFQKLEEVYKRNQWVSFKRLARRTYKNLISNNLKANFFQKVWGMWETQINLGKVRNH